MTRAPELDLALWERGELSSGELEALHPGDEVRELTAMWERLASIASERTPDPSAGWVSIEPRLRERTPEEVRGPVAERGARVVGLRRRSVVAAAIAALLCLGGIAYAAGPQELRETVNHVVGRIASLFGSEDAPPAQAPKEPRREPSSAPLIPASDEHGDAEKARGRSDGPPERDQADAGEREDESGAPGAGDDGSDQGDEEGDEGDEDDGDGGEEDGDDSGGGENDDASGTEDEGNDSGDGSDGSGSDGEGDVGKTPEEEEDGS